jgi:hypothetical protein
MARTQPRWTALAACKDHQDVFFPERYVGSTIVAARSICVTCPVFAECRDWGLAHPEEIPEGILFGYTEVERRAIADGDLEYVDWRFTDWEHPVSKRRMAALERQALQRGEPVVVNVYRLYEIDDPAERHAVIEAYQRWQAEQQCPTSFEQATAMANRAAARQMKITTSRPPCPNGCDTKHVGRYRNAANGDRVWLCYRCRAKIRLTPAEDSTYAKGS